MWFVAHRHQLTWTTEHVISCVPLSRRKLGWRRAVLWGGPCYVVEARSMGAWNIVGTAASHVTAAASTCEVITVGIVRFVR